MLLKSNSHYLTISYWQRERSSREGEGGKEGERLSRREREGDMNHGIGLSSSCAPHLHIRIWKSCQEEEHTLGELSILQSAQSHFMIHTHTHKAIVNSISWLSSLQSQKNKKVQIPRPRSFSQHCERSNTNNSFFSSFHRGVRSTVTPLTLVT